MAPILGTKLGTPAPIVVDLAKPRLRRVAAVASAILITGAVAAWALWPASKPAPTLSLTTETPVVVTVTPAPDAPLSLGWGDRLTIREPMRYGLYKLVTPPPWGLAPFIQAEMGGFATSEACDTALQMRLGYMHQMVASQQPGHVHMRRLDRGFEQTLGPKLTRREEWFCVRQEDQPS
jgi:hypothetical protein